MEEALGFLKWLVLIFVGLFIVWIFTGGPERQTSKSGFFIKPLQSPGEEWRSYDADKGLFNLNMDTDGSIGDEFEKAQELNGISLYKDKIILERGGASSSDYDTEYMIIKSDERNSEKVNITGWILKSEITGEQVTIPKGVYLPFLSKINTDEPVFLSPGDSAIITTGRSPIGISFKTNICSGYLEQFQDFYPYLDSRCPRPEKEPDFITTGPNRLNDQCVDYVTRMSSCTINTKTLPLDMQYECSSYISSQINYNSCVGRHKNEKGFYQDEWRIFLGRETELWKERRETIKLLDANGRIVDTITY